MLSVFVAISVFFALSCGSSSSPEKVAEKFAKAMAKKDFEAAKKVSTEGTHVMIEAVKAFAGSIPGEDITCDDMVCVVDGEKAKCTYTKDGDTETLNLVKLNGKWLVDEKKETGF